MNVAFALLADAANVSREGKLNILGAFDRIYGSKFPLTWPRMMLVMRFVVSAAEYGTEKSIEIVTLDADNSHTPELILRMVRLVREGNDVVVASRFRPGSSVRGLPLSRRFLSRAAGAVFKLTFPIRGIRDYTSGYRAYRAAVLQQVTTDDPDFFDQDGFQVMVDILIKLRRDKNLVFGEAPLILRYDLKTGASKMDLAATTKGTLKLIVQRRLGRF